MKNKCSVVVFSQNRKSCVYCIDLSKKNICVTISVPLVSFMMFGSPFLYVVKAKILSKIKIYQKSVLNYNFSISVLFDVKKIREEEIFLVDKIMVLSKRLPRSSS